MNPDEMSEPLSLGEAIRLAAFLGGRGHHNAAVQILGRCLIDVALVPARHAGARHSGTGWPT